jgi:hypothetical protein
MVINALAWGIAAAALVWLLQWVVPLVRRSWPHRIGFEVVQESKGDEESKGNGREGK